MDDVAGACIDVDDVRSFVRMLDLFDRVVREANPRLPNMLAFSVKRLRAPSGVARVNGPIRHRMSTSGLVGAARAIAGELRDTAARPRQHATQSARADAVERVSAEPLHASISRCVTRTVS